jgi:hypothetical protein
MIDMNYENLMAEIEERTNREILQHSEEGMED